MGYRGKLEEQAQARELRAQAWTLQEIADHLGVAKSSVSLWVRDVAFDPTSRRSVRTDRRPRGVDHPLRRRKLAEIKALDALGRNRLGALAPRDALIAGVALYAGEGSKTDGCVGFANTNPELMRFFCRWLRTFFTVDEERLRARLYLHEGLDLAAATSYWSECLEVPTAQFIRPYRAAADPTLRTAKHVHGCATVTYSCSTTHREIMGLVRALPTVAWTGAER